MRPRLDGLEVRSRWWSGSAEGKEEMRARLGELFRQVRYSPHESVCLVAHSYLLREIFRQFVHPSCVAKAPKLLERLRKNKLANCGVAALEIDCTLEDQPVIGVHLLFGTGCV